MHMCVFKYAPVDVQMCTHQWKLRPALAVIFRNTVHLLGENVSCWTETDQRGYTGQPGNTRKLPVSTSPILWLQENIIP